MHGKFFFAGDEKFFVKGVTYGPVRPSGSHGSPVPRARGRGARLRADGRDGRQHRARLHRAAAVAARPRRTMHGLRCWSAFPGRSTSPSSTTRDIEREIVERAVRRGGARARPPSRDLRLSRRQRDSARHGALARARARARLPEAPRRHGQGDRSRRGWSATPISRRPNISPRFHRFPLLQRLSPPGRRRSAAISRGCTISPSTGRWC